MPSVCRLIQIDSPGYDSPYHQGCIAGFRPGKVAGERDGMACHPANPNPGLRPPGAGDYADGFTDRYRASYTYAYKEAFKQAKCSEETAPTAPTGQSYDYKKGFAAGQKAGSERTDNCPQPTGKLIVPREGGAEFRRGWNAGWAAATSCVR